MTDKQKIIEALKAGKRDYKLYGSYPDTLVLKMRASDRAYLEFLFDTVDALTKIRVMTDER